MPFFFLHPTLIKKKSHLVSLRISSALMQRAFRCLTSTCHLLLGVTSPIVMKFEHKSRLMSASREANYEELIILSFNTGNNARWARLCGTVRKTWGFFSPSHCGSQSYLCLRQGFDIMTETGVACSGDKDTKAHRIFCGQHWFIGFFLFSLFSNAHHLSFLVCDSPTLCSAAYN